MSVPATLLAQIKGFNFSKNLSLLNQNASVGFDISSQVQGDVAAALLSDTAPFPQRDIELAEIGLKASTASPIEFARGADKISFTASGSAFAGLGIYHTGAALLKKLGDNAADFSLDALEFENNDQTLLSILRWGFSAEGKASGAMALGAVGTATLTASGNAEGLFAVVRRLPATTPARTVVQQTADSWMLPRQISSIDQVEPGTWIIAEVIGGLSVKLGAQLGYDFNWVREAKIGGLSGDIGLRIQMGLNAAIGFSASGRCAVVINRDSDAKALRLRIFRLKTRELDLSFDASVGIQAIDKLLPGKIDDFITAVFGTHGQQILNDLQVLEKWTDPNTKLSDLLAQAGVGGAEKLIAHMAGIDPAQLQQKFDAIHTKVVSFIQKWQDLPHTVSSTILKLVQNQVDLTDVKNIAQKLSTATPEDLSTLLDAQLNRIDFFHTPVGQLLESAADQGVLSLLEKPIADVQAIGKKVLSVLDGSLLEDTLKKYQGFLDSELHLDKIFSVVTDTDFAALDALLKRKLADFLGQDNVVLQDLDKIRKTINLLLSKKDEYYEKALEALHRKYNFELSATYQSTTTDQALLDATFDFSHDPASVASFFQQAVQGNLDKLLETQPPQVTLAAAKISHGTKRQTQIDVTLPFMSSTTTHVNESLASVEAVPSGGGLLFTLNSSDTVADNQRKSTLSLAMALSQASPMAAGVRLHQNSLELNYSLLFAKKNMQVKHLRAQVGPAVKTFFTDKIPDTETFLRVLDQQAEEKIPNGPNLLGNGLISLQVSLSALAALSAGQAWLGLPTERSADVYTAMSRAIQISLKKCVHDSFFSEPEDYVSADASLFLAYCALVPRAPAAQGPQGQPFWDFASHNERRNMLIHPETIKNMQALFVQAQDILKGSSDAQFFKPENASRTLNQLNPDDSRLKELLAAEAEMIGSAFEGGLKIAASQAKTPSEAVKALSDFGSKLTEAFNSDITTLLGSGLQSLGTRIFLDASRSLNAELANQITEANAMLSVEFLKPDSKFDENALLAAGSVNSDDLAFADRVVEITP
jgi:hypothetical protein